MTAPQITKPATHSCKPKMPAQKEQSYRKLDNIIVEKIELLGVV